MSNFVIASQKTNNRIVKVFPGGSVNINTGTSGQANAVSLNPPISGLAATTVQEAIAILASTGDGLPSGGVLGEVLGIVQTAPRGVDWVNNLDGGTFN
jgi:hypothetical protein